MKRFLYSFLVLALALPSAPAVPPAGWVPPPAVAPAIFVNQALAGATFWQEHPLGRAAVRLRNLVPWRRMGPSWATLGSGASRTYRFARRRWKLYGPILASAAVLGKVVLDARKHIVIIDPIVCKVALLNKYGYDSDSITPLVIDRIKSIEKMVREKARTNDFRSPEPSQSLSYQEPENSFPPKWLLQLVDGLFKIGPVHMGGVVVQQERNMSAPPNPSGIVATPNALILLHRVAEGRYEQLHPRQQFLDDPTHVIDDIALEILEDRNPYLTAMYYFNTQGMKAVDIIISDLERCTNGAEEQSRAAVLWGVILANQGKFDEARAKFQEAVAYDPHNAEAYFDLGMLAMDQKDYGSAIAAYRKTLALEPKMMEARLNLAAALAMSRQRPDAEYRKALQMFPKNWQVYSAYSNYLTSQDRFKETEAVLRQAIRALPRAVQGDVWMALGRLLESMKKPQEAEQAYKKALEYQMQKNDAYFALAHLYLPQGRTADALKLLDDAHYPSMNPDDDLMFAYALAEAGQWDKALDFLDRAAQAHPYTAFDQIGHAKLLAEHGNPLQALADLNALAKHFPRDSDVLVAWGEILRDQGELRKALEKAQAAAQLRGINGPSADAASLVAALLAQLGRDQEADAAFERAASLNPNDAGLFNAWGEVLDRLGRSENAQTKHQKAIELKEQQQKQKEPLYPKIGEQKGSADERRARDLSAAA